MTDLFDGLPDIFTDPSVFGEAVVYTPLATGVPLGAAGTINAIWMETPVDGVFADDRAAGTDMIRTEVHVRAANVPAPAEGDLVSRVKTGKAGKVTPPIRPDGKGMIACTLAIV